jgi:ABC-type transporter MlaC component
MKALPLFAQHREINGFAGRVRPARKMLSIQTAMTKAMAAWFLVVAAAAAPAGNPREVVQATVTRALIVLEEAQTNRPESAQAGRVPVERIRPELRRLAAEMFDFDEMARRTLSRHWAVRSPKERSEFVGLFVDLLERSYLGRIEGYAGEKIVYVNETVDDDYAWCARACSDGRGTSRWTTGCTCATVAGRCTTCSSTA